MLSIEKAEIRAGTKVLVRVDWNLPLTEAGTVADASRIEVSLKTIEYIKSKGGQPIIASHFGRQGDSLAPVINFAQNNYPALAEGVEFLENLRKNNGEEENNEEFARELAGGADIYVNEAFSVSHRNHASIVSLPKFLPSFAGFRFLEECQKLSEAFEPERPFLVIFGGAKLETKLPLVEKFLNIADSVFVGGAMVPKAMETGLDSNPKIILPLGDPQALDANLETLKILEGKINEAKFVLWNGPLGNYEKGFVAGTVALARILAESGVKTIVGGGDTLAAIKSVNIENKFYFVSMAGGAMLDFLANSTLPGIEALNSTQI